MKSVSRVPTQNNEVNRIQDQLVPAINDIYKQLINKNNTVTVALSSSASVAVSHGLGYVPNGYIVVGATVGGSVYETGGTATEAIIYLRATTTGVYKILFF
jgi:hypothetical protein